MNWLMGIHKPEVKNQQFIKTPVKYTPSELTRLAGRYFDADTVAYESFSKDRKNLMHLVIHNDSLKWQLKNNTL